MQKTIIALFSAVALAGTAIAGAPYVVVITNKAGKQEVLGENGDNTRVCWCLKNTQTASITGSNGGLIRAFSTSDCTGNYDTIGTNSNINNAEWVNSISFGASGAASTGPASCPNYFA